MKIQLMTKRILAMALALAIGLSTLTHPLTVYADSSKVVTLGADLSDEQKQLILNYFGVTENEVDIVVVTNADEHRYLDNIATAQQIGRRTFSCSYIEPTNSGGIHIKTVNLNWVTCDMIRNALITSGISNCNVIAAAPIEVSGTGALTGIFMAYEQASGEQLDEEKVEIASEELVTTMSIAEDIGQEEASTMLSDLKEEIIVSGIEDAEAIADKIETYVSENKIELTEDQKWQIVELLLKISKQDYDIEEIKKAYKTINETIDEVKEASEKAKNIFQKIWEWLKELWQKITGTYEEIKKTEQYEKAKEALGILAETNDNLLGKDTVVTDTDEYIDLGEESIDEQEEHKESWLDKIKNPFSGNKESEQEAESTEATDVVTFEDFGKLEEIETEEMETEEMETEISTSMLEYVTYDMQNETSESNENTQNFGSPSLDEITK